MHGKGHYLWLLIFAGFTYAVLFKLGKLDLIIYSWPMYFTYQIPDLIERPFFPQHRSILHSKRILRLMFLLAVISWILASEGQTNYYLAFFGTIGYISHLIGDSMTPQGLRR
jgi:membrane-bound metal-dependent hydrolase YbcI (DUF457 family)